MPVLTTSVDPRSPAYSERRCTMLERLDELAAAVDQARAGGGQKHVTRHHARGKLLARERIELLVDRDAPLLELSPAAGWGTQYPVGAGIVTAIGIVERTPCVIVANDPTVRGGAINPYTLRKARRAAQIALANRLPLINLVESAGPDLPGPADPLVADGAAGHEMTRLSANGIPTIAVVFGEATAGSAFVPGLSDYTVFVRDKARVLLHGRPPTRLVDGEFGMTEDDQANAAAAHAAGSGFADFLAEDERDAVRLARATVARLNRPAPACPATSVEPPHYDPAELIAIAPADPTTPLDPREILARVLDSSRFDEFKPAYGAGLCAGWGAVHGYPVAVLGNVNGPLGSAEARKAAQFVQLADAAATPLLFLRSNGGFSADGNHAGGDLGTDGDFGVGVMDVGGIGHHVTAGRIGNTDGADHPGASADLIGLPRPGGASGARQTDVVRYGAMMINALTNSRVPHLVVNVSGGCGVGEDLLSGPAYRPRFLFSWPSRGSRLGSAQLAGVLTSVARHAAEAQGQGYDAEADASTHAMIEYRIGQESTALFRSGRLYDDGVIDPRDTRTVLGLCLAVVGSYPDGCADDAGSDGTAHARPGAGAPARRRPSYGVFRI